MKVLSRYRKNIRKRGLRKISNEFEDFKVFLARHLILPNSSSFTKFIILTRSRSGSNLLTSYLESHQDVYIRGEILGKRKNKPIDKFLDRFFKLQPLNIKASGFKIFYYHPVDDASGEVWEKLLAIPDIKIIHLKRYNLFELAVSREKAMNTGFWSSLEGSTNNVKIKIDPEKCLKVFEWTRHWEEKFGQVFDNHDVMNIVYEDFVKDPVDNLNKLQQFLDITPFPLKSFREKQQKRPVSTIVSNYQEVKQYFQGTKWEIFFHEEN